MPLGPRAPLVPRLSQRAAPALVRLLTSAAWQPRGLTGSARLAAALSSRLQRRLSLSRFAGGSGQRLLLHLPGLIFALRRRRVPAAEPVGSDAGARWPRPAWPAAGPSVPEFVAPAAGAPELPAAAPALAELPLVGDAPPAAAPAEPAATSAPPVPALAGALPAPPAAASAGPGTPSAAGAGAALAGTLLARHAAGWTMLLTETEAPGWPALAGEPDEAPPAAPAAADEPWSEAGGPAGPPLIEAAEVVWPLITAGPGAPSHPLARVLARLPDAPGPARGGPALIGRPPLVLARAAAAVVGTMAATPPVAAAGGGPRPGSPAEAPAAAPAAPAAGPALPAGGAWPATEAGPGDLAAPAGAPVALGQPAAPWPLLVQPPPVAPALLAASGLAGEAAAAVPGHLPLARTLAGQLRPVAADVPRSPAALRPLRPVQADAPPLSPALGQGLQLVAAAERIAGEAPPLPMPLTPPVLPPAVSTVELEAPLQPGYAGASAPLAAPAGETGRAAPAGPFGWEPAFRAPATPPVPPAAPAAGEPALPTVSRSLPLISPVAPLTLVPLAPGEAGPRASGGAGPLAAGADTTQLARSGAGVWTAVGAAWAPASLPLLTGRAPLVAAGAAIDRQAAAPAWPLAGPLGAVTSAGAAAWPAPAGSPMAPVDWPPAASAPLAGGPLAPPPPLLPVWLDRAARRSVAAGDGGVPSPTGAADRGGATDQPGEIGRPAPAGPAGGTVAAGGTSWPDELSAPWLPPLAWPWSLPSLLANPLLPFAPARPAAPVAPAAPLPLLLQRRRPAAPGDGASAPVWPSSGMPATLAPLAGSPGAVPVAAAGPAAASAPWWPADWTPVDWAPADWPPADWPAAAFEPPPLALSRAGWTPAAAVQAPLTRAVAAAPLALLARRPAPLVLTAGQAGADVPATAASAVAGALPARAPVARAAELPGPAAPPLSLLRPRRAAAGAAETVEAAGDGAGPAITAPPLAPAAASMPAAPAASAPRELRRLSGDRAAGAQPAPAGAPPGPALLALPLFQPLPSIGERAPDPRRLAAQRVEESRGAPLPLPLRAPFERLFRTSFADVTVHTDAAAAEATGVVGAAAMALGPRIFFAPGRYQPESPEGGALLAHELTHVVQQRTSPLRMALKRVDGAAQPEAAEAEREAEATESRVRELYQGGGFDAQPLPLARAVAQPARSPVEDAASFVGGDYPGGPALGTDGAPALARIADVTYSNELARAEGQDGTAAGAATPGADGARSPVRGPELRKLANEIYALIKEQLSYERERRGRWL